MVKETDEEKTSDSQTPKQLSPRGTKAIQGRQADNSVEPAINSAQKGSDFENWARENLFNGETKRITILPEDNPRLDELGDGLGITKERRVTDAYWKEDGSIWELKSGYTKGGIDQDQLYEYSLMEQAGFVKVRENGKLVKKPVTSVNYLFDSKAGAEANRSGAANFWYVDEHGKVQLLEDN